ncbi:MAG: FAD-binding oxidoreductase [candidate division Zixibacteria bacterium]|nr:FAD-binding oxidoreductase [candidate division Zixibacteria bacterium]MDH3936954.1 FAD-binding oxidoreductase [candidate division Zixibacteria bacterium]MDH4033453.1 FAD-binding oxidoreductase [candidate division Zixibacteria bacterium]
MTELREFVSIAQSEFDYDRLTWQKQIPTFHPETAQEAARFMALANQHRQRLFIVGFSNIITPEGPSFDEFVAIKSDRLNNLIEINGKDLFVTVGSGYPLREINRHLTEHNLFVPHSDLPYVGSVGGALAVGLTAEMHGHEVPLSRYFLKAEIVTPEGEIITPGSVCFKSVSGYDIVKIYSGSWGLLGFIVSASLRVMPDTGREDYATMQQNSVDRAGLIKDLDESNTDPDAIYSRKIKTKFDPNNVLPLV